MKSLFILSAFLFSSITFADTKIVYQSPLQQGYVTYQELSADNRTLAYVQSIDQKQNWQDTLVLVDMKTKKSTSFAMANGFEWHFTPDSKWAVYMTDEAVHFIDVATQTLHHSIPLKSESQSRPYVAISDDSTKIAFSSKEKILVFDIATGASIFDSGPQNGQLRINFFHHGNKLLALRLGYEQKNESSNHAFVIDLDTKQMTNTCPTDKCLPNFGWENFALSANDQYLFIATELGCRTVCEQFVYSYNLASAKMNRPFYLEEPNVADASYGMVFEYGVEDNAVGIWAGGVGRNGGSMAYYSQAPTDYVTEIKNPLTSLAIWRSGESYFLPKLNKFAHVRSDTSDAIDLCDGSGCKEKISFPLYSVRDVQLAKRAGLMAIPQNAYGMEKSRVINLLTGMVVYETQGQAVQQVKTAFSSDEKFLLLNTDAKIGSQVQVIEL